MCGRRSALKSGSGELVEFGGCFEVQAGDGQNDQKLRDREQVGQRYGSDHASGHEFRCVTNQDRQTEVIEREEKIRRDYKAFPSREQLLELSTCGDGFQSGISERGRALALRESMASRS